MTEPLKAASPRKIIWSPNFCDFFSPPQFLFCSLLCRWWSEIKTKKSDGGNFAGGSEKRIDRDDISGKEVKFEPQLEKLFSSSPYSLSPSFLSLFFFYKFACHDRSVSLLRSFPSPHHTRAAFITAAWWPSPASRLNQKSQHSSHITCTFSFLTSAFFWGFFFFLACGCTPPPRRYTLAPPRRLGK